MEMRIKLICLEKSPVGNLPRVSRTKRQNMTVLRVDINLKEVSFTPLCLEQFEFKEVDDSFATICTFIILQIRAKWAKVKKKFI